MFSALNLKRFFGRPKNTATRTNPAGGTLWGSFFSAGWSLTSFPRCQRRGKTGRHFGTSYRWIAQMPEGGKEVFGGAFSFSPSFLVFW